MVSAVRLCKPFGCGTLQLKAKNGVMRRYAGHDVQQRPVATRAAADAGNKSIVAKWAEDAGLRTNVSLEDWTGDRTESLKAPPVGPVTWPSEQWTSWWKVFFKPNSGYKDVFGVAWPMREDLPKRTDAEIAEARATAAKKLVNIDDDERKRRVIFGSVLLSVALTAMYVAAKLHAHPAERLYLLFPFFLGAAEIASGASGLCTIALASVWDVDGTGMQFIEDPNVDLGIRKKVVFGVAAGAVATAIVMVPYCLWPF